MDPLSALSVAGNIVPFVGFAGDLVLKLKQFQSDYIAGVNFISKVKQTLSDLQDTRDPLLEFLFCLQKQQVRFGLEAAGSTKGCYDQSLKDLNNSCIDVSEELHDLLRKLKPPDNSRERKCENLDQALGITPWNKEELEVLFTRTSRIARELDVRILSTIQTTSPPPSTSRSIPSSEDLLGAFSCEGSEARQDSEKRDNTHPDDAPGKDSGEDGKLQESQPKTDQSVEFACPYRKHNPRKYSVRDWRSCALTSFNSIARVK
jgi:hypothetical protein